MSQYTKLPPRPEELREILSKRKEFKVAKSTEIDEMYRMPDVYAAILETQCGPQDDSQPVEQYDGTLGVTTAFVNQHETPVGQLQWNSNLATIYTNPGNVNGARWCTGTLISGNLFLTAGHCFDDDDRSGWIMPRVNGTDTPIPPTEIATRMHVNFNYQDDPSGNPRTVTQVAIEELIEYRLGGLDFAIVRLAGNPGGTFGQATVATTDAAVNDMLCIIGHPAGVPKRIEAGPLTSFQGHRIRYDDIDTLGGNSGSGILQSPSGQIVGIHTNGGCTTAGTGSNFGVRISRLLEESPTLQDIISPKSPFVDIKIKFNDDVASLKQFDDLKVKFSDDPKLKFSDDPKLKVVDDPKLKFADDPKLKFFDDPRGTLKYIDDVKSPGLDKQFGDVKQPGTDGFGGRIPRVDPRVNPIKRNVRRPFILQTPHHSMHWAGQQQQANTEQQQYEAHLQEYAAQISQCEQMMQQMMSEIETLSQQYEELVAQYQAIASEYQQRFT